MWWVAAEGEGVGSRVRPWPPGNSKAADAATGAGAAKQQQGQGRPPARGGPRLKSAALSERQFEGTEVA